MSELYYYSAIYGFFDLIESKKYHDLKKWYWLTQGEPSTIGLRN
ncbi:hypothetical protein SAMN04488001_1583 [Litoreibacter albidus]|uniref:Uncharacterized protein n=1 Tax=Litoreibacter albidus TaxID=670155 RepID=A0A1H2VP13_9RHOB|nr:hypothetical protein SAMN04488001_1583 [Litoreibacter albidus]